MWKRAPSYNVARRLAELLRDLQNIEFSSARWRRSVRRFAQSFDVPRWLSTRAAAIRTLHQQPGTIFPRVARYAVTDDSMKLKEIDPPPVR